MNSTKESILLIFNAFRCFPHLLIFLFHKNRRIIKVDIKRGLENINKQYNNLYGLLYLLSFCREYRNLFYHRIRPYSAVLNIICPKQSTLFIQTQQIGEGLLIIHGFASAIGAQSIGKNCTIFQLVTIGGTDHGAPILMDNVKVYAGAIIVGKITIGNNVVIGANATVYKNVPDNSLVLPGTSKIMKWKNRKVLSSF